MSFLLEDDQARRRPRSERLAALPEDVRFRTMERLASPGLVASIVRDFAVLGIAGEQMLALTLFLVGTSRLIRKPLAAIVQGPSSSGKSYVLEQVAGLFPPEEVLSATDMTANALYYMPPGELVHRFVVAGERTRHHNDENAQATKALREMLASGRLSKVVTVSDGDGPRTERIEQQGPIAFAESTTAVSLFEEDANRCLVLQPDERPEQTREILRASAHSLTGEGFRNRELLLDEFRALQLLVEPLPVAIPFAVRLAERFPVEPIEVRRAFGHVTSLIQTSALLHQYQRGRDDLGQIVAQPEDYWLARLLLVNVFARTLGQQPADALRRFVEQLCRHQLSGEYTAREIAKFCRLSERTVREHLQELLQRECVEQTQISRGPLPARWLIPAGIDLEAESSDLLPAVEDVCECDIETLTIPEFPAEWCSVNLNGVPF